jgi:hypothetical protein
VIAFLDLLRDQLWEAYGDEITAMMQDAGSAQPNEQQIAVNFESEPDF